jgi:ribonuclease R
MLAANEAVARWFGRRKLPTIYRVHGLPDEEKLRAFLDLARTHGFDVPDPPVDPRALNALLHRFRGHAQQRALNQLLLRAMMQAVYSPENIGHYGLAAEHYLHFTSPIRRYPDLVVHRLLAGEWSRRQGGPTPPPAAPALEETAVLASDRERAAMESEREIVAYYGALLMRGEVGERHRGVVSAVADFGFFVEIERWFVEGLVRADQVAGRLELDTRLHALVDRAGGRAFRVGDAVEVEVVSADPGRRRIELRLAGEAGAALPARPRGPSRPARGPGAEARKPARRRGGQGPRRSGSRKGGRRGRRGR